MSEPYGHSGRPGLAFLLPIVGIVSATAASFVYAWVDVRTPKFGALSLLSLLFVVAWAFAVGAPVMWAGRLLRVRDVATMRAYGAATGALAVYLAWAFFAWWFFVFTAPETMPPMAHWLGSPRALWNLADLFSETGWYSYAGGTFVPKGLFLWACWLAEAAIVIVACVWLAPRRIVDRPFCEDCDRWMREEDATLMSADDAVNPRTVRKLGLAAIAGPTPPARDAVRCLCIRRWRCAKCETAAVYRVDQLMLVESSRVLWPVRAIWPWARSSTLKAEAEPIVPLSWQRAADDAELARVDAALRAATVTARARSRRS
jgi:hypothetical protein